MNNRAATVGLALVLALLTGALGYVLGSRTQPEAVEGGRYLRSLTEDLELRADQITRIDEVLSEADADIERLLEEHRRALREPIAARLQATEDEVLAILDGEQRSRYRELTRD